MTVALRTIASEHKDLQQISFYNSFGYDGVDEPFDIGQIVGGAVYGEWMDLDRLLVQLVESHAVRTKIYSTKKEGEVVCTFMKYLLPEMTKRGAIELVVAREEWSCDVATV
jgi:hypothetical protein